MYFPVDEVTRKMEYYIVNGGGERKWNKRTESSCSTNVKSSLLGCLVFRGSVSAEHGGSLFPPHSISFPPWEEGNMFELVDRACHTYMYMYMFGFQKTCIIVCLS